MAANSREKLAPTPEATVGPFYPGVFVDHFPADLTLVAATVVHRPEGDPVSLKLRFLDAAGRPVPSVIVECWQANAHGRYRHPEDRSGAPLDPQFDGFARMRSDNDGACMLTTIKPGPHRLGNIMRAPHFRLMIFASGIDRLDTQIFLQGEDLNATDPVLNSIGNPEVRDRLIARRAAADSYQLTIHLRGDCETPFFERWEEGIDG